MGQFVNGSEKRHIHLPVSILLQYGSVSFSQSHACSHGTIICSNEIQFPARFQNHHGPVAPPGTTEISLSNNVAYERCNHENNPDGDDHQYEKLDEYQA